jgi:hypothetical protein
MSGAGAVLESTGVNDARGRGVTHEPHLDDELHEQPSNHEELVNDGHDGYDVGAASCYGGCDDGVRLDLREEQQ